MKLRRLGPVVPLVARLALPGLGLWPWSRRSGIGHGSSAELDAGRASQTQVLVLGLPARTILAIA